MDLTRRDALKVAGLTAGAGLLASSASAQMVQPATIAPPTKLRIKQSVCRWCYDKIPIKTFFQDVKDSGLKVVDLLQPEEWAVAKEFDLGCSMSSPKNGRWPRSSTWAARWGMPAPGRFPKG